MSDNPLLARLTASSVGAVQADEAPLRGRFVGTSPDFRRIFDLPRRTVDYENYDLAETVGNMLHRAHSGYDRPTPLPLRPAQAAALCEAAWHRSALVVVPVGGGKSWMAALFACDRIPEWADEASWPQILCQRPVLLMPPGPKAEMLHDVLPALRRAYAVHSRLQIVTYGELQQPDAKDLLLKIKPDLVIADEVQMLKNPQSARTKRVGAVLAATPEVPFVGLTATLSDGSLRDWSLPARWTHPPSRGHFVGRWSPAEGASFADDCPLPYSWPELEEWADALDAVVPPDRFCAPGVLKRFCEAGEDHKEGFGRRLGDTAGVVLVPHESVNVPLEIRAIDDIGLRSKKVLEVEEELERTWTIGGEDVPDALTLARKKRELAMGFHYKWIWQNGTPDLEWLRCRKIWVDTVRHVIRHMRTGLDTELLVRNAVKAGELPASVQGAAAHALLDWETAQKFCRGPDTVAEWLCGRVLAYARVWGVENKGIVWTEHDAVLDALATRMPAYGAGEDEEVRQLARIRGGKTEVALSRSAHGTGKNLQGWSKNLVLSPPPSGKAWEQMLGRTHRSGQTKAVTCEVLTHVDIAKESMSKAVAKARTTEKTTLVPQKLLRAVATGWTRL